MTSLQEKLFAMQDNQYAAFQTKLTPGVSVEGFIGIRVLVLRKFAKEFTKEKECLVKDAPCLLKCLRYAPNNC